jgi:hypothetical protein
VKIRVTLEWEAHGTFGPDEAVRAAWKYLESYEPGTDLAGPHELIWERNGAKHIGHLSVKALLE